MYQYGLSAETKTARCIKVAVSGDSTVNNINKENTTHHFSVS